ncbi:hypothetical protein T484DRAFT_1760250 [Baffinella frigidus]|nr:hypothetical protein T484DRAFT_1760250 [Cryptophyta sp. CCMP2293]
MRTRRALLPAWLALVVASLEPVGAGWSDGRRARSPSPLSSCASGSLVSLLDQSEPMFLRGSSWPPSSEETQRYLPTSFSEPLSMGGGVGWEPRITSCVIDSPAEPGLLFVLPAARAGVELHGFELWSRLVNVPLGMEGHFELAISINFEEFGRWRLPAESEQVRNSAGDISFKAVLPLSHQGTYQLTLSLVQRASEYAPEAVTGTHTSFTVKRAPLGEPLPFPEEAWSRHPQLTDYKKTVAREKAAAKEKGVEWRERKGGGRDLLSETSARSSPLCSSLSSDHSDTVPPRHHPLPQLATTPRV